MEDEQCKEYIMHGMTCSEMYNCCDCGGIKEGCGCPYCWSCNACNICLNNN